MTRETNIERVHAWLKAGNVGSPMDIACALDIDRESVYYALHHLRRNGQARIGMRAITTHSRGNLSNIWAVSNGVKTATPVILPVPREPAKAPEAAPRRNLTIVERALMAQPPLAKVWMQGRVQA